MRVQRKTQCERNSYLHEARCVAVEALAVFTWFRVSGLEGHEAFGKLGALSGVSVIKIQRYWGLYRVPLSRETTIQHREIYVEVYALMDSQMEKNLEK